MIVLVLHFVFIAIAYDVGNLNWVNIVLLPCFFVFVPPWTACILNTPSKMNGNLLTCFGGSLRDL